MWRLPAEPQVVFHVGSSSRKLPLVSRRNVRFFAVRSAHGVLDRRNCLTTCTKLDIAVSTWKSYRESLICATCFTSRAPDTYFSGFPQFSVPRYYFISSPHTGPNCFIKLRVMWLHIASIPSISLRAEHQKQRGLVTLRYRKSANLSSVVPAGKGSAYDRLDDEDVMAMCFIRRLFRSVRLCR
jgi:hypothetical protein